MKRHLIPALIAATGFGLAAPLTHAETARENAREVSEAVKEAGRDTRDAAKDSVARLDPDHSTQPVKDAFIHGKIMTAVAVNPHASAYDIDVKVDNGVAHLSGTVDTEIEKDLVVEIARSIDGVSDVRSDLKTKAGSREATRLARDKARSVGQTLDDAGTTAAIKSKLLANKNTSGLKINVTTRNNVVTLSGSVASETEKDLAGLIARNSSDVASVRNELSVSRR